ncbi:MAG: cob(I)yrinic acid a,c-diamide adenosyltransferase [Chloroflexi bacterium]|nr:cob(I)yrinic acid a,c-diamide adenosyltransferase [Chloroflexota bacterium]
MTDTVAPAASTTATQPTEERPKPRLKKGLVIVNTGNGKGKTTAAVGLAVRAAGNKMRVLIVQFIKGKWKTGEQESLKRLAPEIELVRMGKGFTIDRLRDKRVSMDDHEAAARAAWDFAVERVKSGEYAVVVLDEILGTVKAGLVSVDELLDLVRSKPSKLHLVLTGRNAPPALVEAADLVTEMNPVKHPYAAGIMAQRGVEF